MSFSGHLLDWFDSHRRYMPWRKYPTPYRVLVSEIMLQQTRVTTVLPYFDRFMQELPDIGSLANVPEEKLLVLWQGLGYYSRALNLKKAAMQIVDIFEGEVPGTKEELQTLAGIGDYTAGAVASIAFGKKVTAVDGNVLRVFSRILNSPEDIRSVKTKRRIDGEVFDRMPDDRPGDFNQALMELGALICLPKNPKCEICPVKNFCEAEAEGTQSELPVKGASRPRSIVPMTVLVLMDGGQYALRKRGSTGLLKRMWEFANEPGHLSEAEVRELLINKGYVVESIRKGPSRVHVFSHVEWDMISFFCEVEKSDDSLTWIAAEEISDYAIPSAFIFLLNGNELD